MVDSVEQHVISDEDSNEKPEVENWRRADKGNKVESKCKPATGEQLKNQPTPLTQQSVSRRNTEQREAPVGGEDECRSMKDADSSISSYGSRTEKELRTSPATSCKQTTSMHMYALLFQEVYRWLPTEARQDLKKFVKREVAEAHKHDTGGRSLMRLRCLKHAVDLLRASLTEQAQCEKRRADGLVVEIRLLRLMQTTKSDLLKTRKKQLLSYSKKILDLEETCKETLKTIIQLLLRPLDSLNEISFMALDIARPETTKEPRPSPRSEASLMPPTHNKRRECNFYTQQRKPIQSSVSRR